MTFLRIVRALLLKGAGVQPVWPPMMPLAVFGAVVFTLSVLRFRKQLD